MSRSAVLQAAYGSLMAVLDWRQPRSYALGSRSRFAGSGPGGRRYDVSPVPAGDRGQDYYEQRYQSRVVAHLMRRAQQLGLPAHQKRQLLSPHQFTRVKMLLGSSG